MSVRRLAEASVQPASFAFNEANAETVSKWIAKYPKGREQSAIIPLLMIAQDQEGWVSKPAIEAIADMLGMPYIRALEVATFYTQYQLKPVGTKAHVQVCGTTPCMLRGAGALIETCQSKIHHDQFHTNADGTLSWEEVECLGACVNAPMVMIFKDTYEDLTPERLAEIIDAFEAGNGHSVPVGPQVARTVSAPASGMTTLTDERAVLDNVRAWQEHRRAAEQAAAATAAAAPAASVPPSQAAKPKTDAPETNAATKSPSPVKANPAAEDSASKAPAFSAEKANISVDTGKQRSGPGTKPEPEPADLKSPELLKGEPIGAAGRKADAKPSLDSPDRPKGMDKPAAPDDLQLISGVGPKIEGILHSLGIFTFAQVAAWSATERDWVDGYLNFKGRIDRDDWVKQADALARGGRAEYIRVFGKEPR
ncbi:MAG: NADH-quinone oxidoreductase subunit E [Rhizobiaceae bacterium]|nr:NADH-quinone oxidoreductase subunit E [Rhizobiaceae bacterium]